MKLLYKKLLDLLTQIPEIRHIDLDAGQTQMEKPPLAYPAILVRMTETPSNITNDLQQVSARVDLTIINKTLSKTDSLTPKKVMNHGLAYLDLCEKVWQKLQGYSDADFEPFENVQNTDPPIRVGLKTVIQSWTTSYKHQKNKTKKT